MLPTGVHKKSFFFAASLLGLAILLSTARLHTYREPLERDLSLYLLVGRELLSGRRLYVDIWDHKPPLIYATYGLAEKIAGPGPGAVYLLNILAGILSMLGVYRAGSALGGNRMTGLWAAVFWTLLSGDAHLQANQPNVEVFLNACLIWAFVWLVGTDREQPGHKSLWAAGFLLVLSSLYKPVTIAVALPLILLHVFFDKSAWRRRLTGIGGVACIGVALWGITLSYFWMTHRLQDFIDALFTYNRFYMHYIQADSGRDSGGLITHFASSVDPRMLMASLGSEICILFILLAGLALTGWFCQSGQTGRRCWVLWAGYCAGVQAAIAWPGRTYPHYFQLWIPPLVVGAAWGVENLRLASQEGRSWLSGLAAGSIFFVSLLYELPLYAKSPEDWSRLKYNEEVLGVDKMGRAINGWLEPGETFYEWGSTPGLYVSSGRRPPAAVLDKNVLTEGPLCHRLTQKVLQDLEREQPELFVSLDWMLPAPMTAHPVTRWIWQRYHRLPGPSTQGHVVLMIRRGGRLEQRLQGAPV